ncbi:MAG: triose-phosphate isomerase [Candidatus Sungbacteria bacterium]|nr:triose-phosphate isomerase [Candidatus Sungbacteria bacterium]
MKNLIIANWKANPVTLREAVDLARKTELAALSHRTVEVIVAPPFPFLIAVLSELKRVKLGSQNAFWEDAGPYTGEISWQQLKSLKVSYVIVGHSERRIFLGETDEMVGKKVRALLEHGLKPVLCVGERERASHEVSETIARQLEAALAGVKKSLLKNLIIAYEPIWAISTMPGSHPDTPENAFQCNIYIRKILSGMFGRTAGQSVRIIYGGSVNANNIKGFLSGGHMQGALVGGASLKAEEFARLIASAALLRTR